MSLHTKITDFGKLKKASDSYEFDFSDSFSDKPKRITQTRYFVAGDVAIAIAHLGRPNTWDDEAFDAACEHLKKSWAAQ